MFYFYPHENIVKPQVFCRFQGVQKWKIGIKWVNHQPSYYMQPWHVKIAWNFNFEKTKPQLYNRLKLLSKL